MNALPQPAITREHPVTTILLQGLFRLIPIPQHHRGRPAFDSNIPLIFSGLAQIINHIHLMPRHSTPHRARHRRIKRSTARHNHIALGLAVKFVDGHTQGIPAPSQHFRAQWLAARGNTAQSLNPRIRCFQHPQRRRWKEHVAHIAVSDNLTTSVRVEFRHSGRNDRHPQGKPRHKHIKQATDPGPIRRGPKAIALLPQKIMAHLNAGQMPSQNTVPMQRAFRRPRRAAGIDQNRWIIRPSIGKRLRSDIHRQPIRHQRQITDHRSTIDISDHA